MEQGPPTELVAYHGCNADSVAGILAENFRLPEDNNLWFGKAAYFYADCRPFDSQEHAKQWAIKVATHKQQRPKFLEFAVLRVLIRSWKLLDLTTDDGKAMLEKTKVKIREQMSPVRDEYEDTKVIAFMVDQFRFDVLINDVVSRFGIELVMNIRSHTPNSRIVSVYDPKTCIDRQQIVLLSTGPTSQI